MSFLPTPVKGGMEEFEVETSFAPVGWKNRIIHEDNFGEMVLSSGSKFYMQVKSGTSSVVSELPFSDHAIVFQSFKVCWALHCSSWLMTWEGPRTKLQNDWSETSKGTSTPHLLTPKCRCQRPHGNLCTGSLDQKGFDAKREQLSCPECTVPFQIFTSMGINADLVGSWESLNQDQAAAASCRSRYLRSPPHSQVQFSRTRRWPRVSRNTLPRNIISSIPLFGKFAAVSNSF